jgi:hypothetical protein
MPDDGLPSEEDVIRTKMRWLADAELEAQRQHYARELAKLENAGLKFDKPPVIVTISGTPTVLAMFRGQQLNIAIGEIADQKKFDPVTIGDKVWWAYKSQELSLVKRKLLEERRPKDEYQKRREERKQVKLTPEFGGLQKFLGGEAEVEEQEEAGEEAKKEDKFIDVDESDLLPSERIMFKALEKNLEDEANGR